ncbi:hypothetical protein H0S56_00430 [Acinetobacter lwoffii]|uniref:hypothetical protein n=1 Tax=Acinetobacter lwoffii TaxID=28090 RepID=UPI0018A03A63|nr:hypothetical protein [Acinetobacter lwoffii]QPF32218.1 hypothetical protein H0S56_00430 [Acinetobacter lwoffii]
MFKIIFLKNERNDATDYYVSLIQKAIENHGYEVKVISEFREIEKDDKVLTISLKGFFFTWLRNPRQFIIHWFQGVTPEEALMLYKDSFQKRIRWTYLSFFEKFVLHYSKFNFFVSEAMLRHYINKYRYNRNNYMIMPCYNQKINISGFNKDKYKYPTFVYAGSLSDWQCINETLIIFKNVQKVIANAKMYLYTAEKDKALKLIDNLKVPNVIIDYIPYSQLNRKLEKIKYGFLIREDVLVNNVSTPTKMNGYLANGVIPIFSNCIDDFNLNLIGDFLIKVDPKLDVHEYIIKFEDRKIYSDNVLKDFSQYFERYYNDDYYLNLILIKFSEFKVI